MNIVTNRLKEKSTVKQVFVVFEAEGIDKDSMRFQIT